MRGDMKVVKIRQDKFDTLMHLDMLGLLERAHFPGYMVYACVDDTPRDREDNGKDYMSRIKRMPFGMVMFYLRKDTLYIEWLYVDVMYRNRGCADALLAVAFKMKENGQCRQVCAYLPQVDERKRICSGEDAFLSEYFEDERVILPGEWITTLGGFEQYRLSEAAGRQDAKGETKCESFQNIPADRVKEILGAVSEVDTVYMLYAIHELVYTYDAQLSFFIYDGKGQIHGALMIQRIGRTFYPILFFGKDKDVTDGLWSHFLDAALQNYPASRSVVVILRKEGADERIVSYLNNLFQTDGDGYGRRIDAGLLYERREYGAQEEDSFWDEFDTNQIDWI